MNSITFYTLTVAYPLGFFGHACSLLTFSARKLRVTSTGLFFLLLTIFDLLYLLMSIYDFIIVVLQLPTVPDVRLCRFRTFILNFSSVMSTWILTLISVDRLIRIRFPYRQARLCTFKRATYAATVLCLLSLIFSSHVLQPEFTFADSSMRFCSPPRSSSTPYAIFYFRIWPSLQLCITYLLPTCVMTGCVTSIYLKMYEHRTIAPVMRTRRERTQRQLLILMISNVVWFGICTIPWALLRVVIIRSQGMPISSILIDVLSAFLNMNYCFNFYIHCLTSRLFRKTLIKQLRRSLQLRGRQNNNRVQPWSGMIGRT